MTMRALVFGGTGQLGHAVAKQLLETGWQVKIVTRSGRPPASDLMEKGGVPIDGANRSSAEVVLADNENFDAIFDPTTYTAEQATNLLSAKHRFGTLVTVSSASVYCDKQGRTLDEAGQNGFPDFGGPLKEDNPTVAPGTETYSTHKVAMENAFLDDGLPVSILRPCAIYGQYARHPREFWLIKRALDKRPFIPLAFNAQSIFHTSSVQGIAKLAELCMRQPATRIFNVADPDPKPVADIADAVFSAIGMDVPLLPFEGAGQGQSNIGFSPWSVEKPMTVNTEAAQAFGWDGGPVYRDAISDYCQWLVATTQSSDWRDHFTMFTKYGYDPFDYDAEDAFAAAR